MDGVKTTTTLLLVLGLTCNVIGQLVRVNSGLEVPIGRSVSLDQDDLVFEPVEEGEQCKVEVALNEPYYQKVGLLQPEVFDCEFLPETIKYTHSGLPYLDHDVVKLRVYKFTETDTVSETVYLRVNISLNSYQTVRPTGPLQVDRFFGSSELIDMRVLDLAYERYRNVSCMVHINTVTSGFPKYGELTKGEGEEKVRVRALTADCYDFMMGMIRYEHLVPPTPNIDYIPMTVTTNDPLLIEGTYEEVYYLPVEIAEAFPNQNPIAAMMSMYVMEADQFILTTITPSVISGRDDETANEDLVFFISQPFGPDEGYIVNLDDHTHPIESFTQYDLSRLNIAYKPPIVSSAERRVFTAEFTVYDTYFAESNPINLMVSVRTTETNAPRVSVNTGLTMLEGQSRIIRPTDLQLVDNDNLNFVRAKVVGGLRHGRLYNNERPVIMFSAADINSNTLVYRHDDSDTLKDSIELRITDGRHSVRTTFPINILPKDDSAPYLINNVQFELQEGSTIRITRFLLVAADMDSSDDYIIFRITQPPVAGEILKKFSEDAYGYPVTEFTQKDLFRGLIYYHHLGGEVFLDTFELVLLDNQIPPNESPTQVVMVKISPVHDLPPERVSGSTQSLIVLETEIAYITKNQLHFTDAESTEEHLRYTITTPPYITDTHSLTNAGRVISTVDVLSPAKDPNMPAIRSFTQGEVNMHNIAYMPPLKEIGPNPVHIRFVFSVSDPFGNLVLGELFDVTVLPVNNQEPVLRVNDLTVREGQSLIFDPVKFSVSDMDTEARDLIINFLELPEHGRILLNGVNLTVGNHVTMSDVAAGRVSYMSDGSESSSDQFTVSLSDGVHSITEIVTINVIPVNDEVPALLPGLESELTIPEGGSVTIGSDVLSATDPDTNDLLLHYIVVMHPLRGVLLKDGVIVNRFSQRDVNRGKIVYEHTGGETGLSNIQDVITFIVSDKSIPSNPDLPVKDVIINIAPSDDRPPRIVFGNPFFVNEGEKAPLTVDVLSAVDRDSPLGDLRFVITRQPVWGFVENVLPTPGFEKSNAGKPITSFTFQDITDGNINFVQSPSSRMEPISDSFMLYVTDGEHSSPNVTFVVNITPQNDEVPTLTVRNFTVHEGSFFKIRTDTINANDLDIPMDMLMFSIVRAPEHGMIINRVPTLVESPTPVYDFNINQLLNTLSLAYVHDDSESTEDRFVVRVTDGKHTVRKTVNITIIPVNDESPEIIKNAGIRISIRENRIISSVILRTEDRDTPDDYLVYTLNSLPRRGTLQRKVAEDTWEDITDTLTNFTQWDLNQNLIRYVHSANLGSKGIDRFYFSVSDGVHSTGKQNFRIMIQNTKREPLIITNNGLQLDEGQTVIIPPTILSANDNSGQLTDILFNVLSSPTQGHLEDVARPGIPLTTFSQMDILGQRLVYRHLRVDQINNDEFTFSVTNGYEVRNDTFQIVVNPVDNMLPVLMVKEEVTVAQNGFQIISLSQLHALDPDTPASSVFFVVTQMPNFGTLLIGGLPIEQRFTQQDIDNYDISYRHDFGQADTDEFFFVVEDGTNRGFLTGGNIQYEPVRFQININIVDSSPPEIITNVGPTKMQTMLDRTGFVFSNMNLQAVDDCSADDVTYSVVKDPMFGHLEYVDTFQRIQGRFVQTDINNKRVMYVMRDNARAANDSFMFDVWDCHGNSLKNQRFSMHWSVVMFSRPQFMVCESDGTLSIPIIRIGNQLLSSFVSLELQDLTATSGLDYQPSRARLLQFDPAITSVAWDAVLMADDLEETRERFRLTLVDPVNAVIGEYNRITVVIKDSKNGVCKSSPTDVQPSVDIPGCCGDQSGIVDHQLVPVPGIPPQDPYPYNPDAGSGPYNPGVGPDGGPGLRPGPYNPGEGPGPGPYNPEAVPDGGIVGGPDLGPGPYNPGGPSVPGQGPYNPGGDPIFRPGPYDPYQPGVGDPVFNEGSLVDADPAINDGPPVQYPPGAPRVEQQPFDPYAEETWYRYPFGVGYDGTDGTRYEGPYGSQPIIVEPLPDQNCCEDGLVQPGSGTQPGVPNPNFNPNQQGNLYPIGNPNPYPQGQPSSPGNPPSHGPSTNFEQPFVPPGPGGYPPPQGGVEPDQPPVAPDGDVRLYHATVGGAGGQTHVVPILLADNRPGQLEEDQPPESEVSNVFLPTVVRGVQRPRLTPGDPSGGSSPVNPRQFPLGQGNAQVASNNQPPPDAESLFPFPCTPANRGEIRQDADSGSLAKCDGTYWVEFDISQLVRAITGTATGTDYDNGQCERGWSYHNSRCFLISRHAQSWNEAQKICRERYNGNLASILSKRELKWLGDLLNGETAWIGLNDKQVEDQWEWVSGDPITFSRWSPSARASNRSDRYDCTYITARLRWFDKDCDTTAKSYVCMKNAE
ncbi:FRAS1-related extracellular matrix protein 1-like [Lytechinus pictus]|uniref:FRAS1-related extracellular matrix protein 1-like n=1 Tax=Lytechinus pictus TaxID=7653 RepID=UPI0030B9D046